MCSKYQSSRKGITLLFVVSMIVLFLLMGTAFVVLAGDFMRSSKARVRFELERFDQPEALIEKVVYDLLRGPDLNDVSSPLRFHDVLGDQYGYGLKAFVSDQIEFYQPSLTNGQIIRLRLEDYSRNVDHANRILTFDPNNPTNSSVSLNEFSESYAGQVLSIVNGPETSFSGRVVYHEFDPNSQAHWLWVSVLHVGKSGQNSVTQAYLDGLKPFQDSNGHWVRTEVIINNRDFGGTGPAYNPNDPVLSPAQLDTAALRPNRFGLDLTSELGPNGYLYDASINGPSDKSLNEPWDSIDGFSTLFLAGYTDENISDLNYSRWMPSFHRETLVGTLPNPNNRLPNQPHIFSTFPLWRQQTHEPGNPAGKFWIVKSFAVDPQNPNPSEREPLVDTDNDGVGDSFWIDVGFPVKSHRGTFYKPLAAIKIVDMDGRLNLNAHGELTDTFADYFIATSLPMRGTPASDLPRGQGMGPADISLRPMFGTDFASYQNLVQNRYGNDGLVGSLRNGVSNARVKMFGHPFDTVDWNPANMRRGTIGNLFGSSAMDIRGRFALGRPVQASMSMNVNDPDYFIDPNYPAFPNSMPVIDVRNSNVGIPPVFEMENSAYGLSFAPIPWNWHSGSDDTPYAELELERVLRPNDIDVNLLAARLWNTPSNPPSFWNDKREIVTTSSFEVPTSRFASLLFFKAAQVLSINQPWTQMSEAQRTQVRTHVENNMRGLFAPELFQGRKMDINRPFGNGYDDDGDGVVDNPEEAFRPSSDPRVEINLDQRDHFASTPRAAEEFEMDLNNDGFMDINDQNSRLVFARHLYCLAMLMTDDVASQGNQAAREAYAKTIAQWAVNVVDFRDPDSIMTQFHFDPFPFENGGSGPFWNPPVTGVAPNTVPDPNYVVWGMERPELLITETFAAHARRMDGPSGTPEQGLRPEPFAFIELYNPNTQNSLNQQFDASLYVNQGVDLARANNNGDPVWRIQIDRPARRRGNPTSLRFVYFRDPGAADRGDNSATQEVFFTTYAANPVRPGSQALIGTQGISAGANRYRCYMGRLSGKTIADENPDNLQLDDTSYIELDLSNPNNPVVRRNLSTLSERSVSTIVPIDRYRGQSNPTGNPRPFSVSDPFGGYPDVSLPTVIQVPDGYRYITPYTQPNLLDPYSADPNDHNRDSEDLAAVLQKGETTEGFRIIYLQRLANPAMPWNADFNPYIAVDSFEMDLLAFDGTRDDSTDPTGPAGSLPRNDRAESLERNNQQNADRLLWRSSRGDRPGPVPPLTDHYFDKEHRDSLGRTNDLFQPNDPQLAFPWLSWGNRPFASQMELMNVPFTSSLEFVQEFSVSLGINPYIVPPVTTPPNRGGDFSHLPNFFFYQDLSRPHMFTLMEFLEVPSRFAGTTLELIPTQPNGSNPGFALNPFNTISRYREPGKININTISDHRVYEAYMGAYANLNGGLTWDNFRASRRLGQIDENPFRSSFAGALVPNGFTVARGPESTLFRSRGWPRSSDTPLFDFTPNDPNVQLSMDAERSAYFRHAMRQRLGNITTDRSSVFAIWVTVGFFEWDPVRNELSGVEHEMGHEDGTTKRHRGFFIFDRSIPVAYEPGKNHNIDQAILVRRIIE